MFLEGDVVTFKETFDLLQGFGPNTVWFGWMFGPTCASSPFFIQAI